MSSKLFRQHVLSGLIDVFHPKSSFLTRFVWQNIMPQLCNIYTHKCFDFLCLIWDVTILIMDNLMTYSHFPKFPFWRRSSSTRMPTMNAPAENDRNKDKWKALLFILPHPPHLGKSICHSSGRIDRWIDGRSISTASLDKNVTYA